MEEDFYVPGFTNSLTSGEQSLPTAQPVQTAAYTDDYAPLDLGDWNPSMVNLGNLNLLSDPGPAYDPNSVVRFDTGAKIGVPDASGGFTYQNAAPVVVQPGTAYTLTDYSGNILGQGSTVDEVQKLVALADQNAARGWNLYQGDPVAGGQLFERSPQDNTLKNILIAGATAMGAGFLGPYIQGAGAVAPGAVGAAATPLGAGLAAGAVNTAANLATGANLVDALKSGAMAGLSSAAMTGLLGGGKTPNVGDLQAQAIDTADFLSGMGVNPTLANQIASGSVSNIGSAAGGFGGTGGGAGGNLIQVIGNKGVSNIPSSFFSNAIGSATGALSGTNYGNQVWDRPAAQEAEVQEPGSNEYDPANKEIVVKSGKYKVDFDPKSILNNFLNADYTGTPDYEGLKDLIDRYNNMYEIEEPYADEDIVVKGAEKNPTVVPDRAKLPDIFPPLNSVDIPTDLVKEWPEIPPRADNLLPDIFPPLNSVDIPTDLVKEWPEIPPRADNLLPDIFPPLNSVDIPPADTFKPSADGKGGTGGVDIGDILTILGLLGGLGGAGGGGGTSKGPSLSSFAGMRGPLNPIFSAQLPAPNMQPTTPRSMGGTDWYRYGYGPEQSFFTNVPQGALNTSTAYTGYEDNAGRTAAAPLSFSSGMSAYGAPSMSFGSPLMSSGVGGTQQGPAAAALAAGAPKPLTQEQRDAARRAQFDADWAKNRAQFTPEELAERDKRIAAYREEMSRWTPSPPTVAELPPAIDPTLLSDLYDRLGKLEALNQRYIDEYGVPSERLLKVAQGSYLADAENPAPFTAFKPKMDAYRTELQKLFGGQTGAGFIFGDPYQARRDLEQKLVLAEGIRNQIGTPGTAPEVVKNLREMYDRQLYELRQPIEMSKKYATPVTKSHGGSVGHEGYAIGGYAVGGPGDGRDDKIPAMLSDGEYVMDAETVAMLGNGSSKAGAEALDKFRVNLRKHKGRKLSKGEFSVNAKKPEQYLKGRS